MSFSEQIDQIIAKRKALLPQVTEAEDRLNQALEVVSQLEIYRDKMETGEELSPMASIASLTTGEFKKSAEEALASLDNLKKRFSRDKINISFVGRAGQGKSLVLQKISGLKGDVIPSSDGTDCTGARSIISNNSDSASTLADISFFSESEIVEIVNKYLEAILGSRQKMVGSLAGIAGLDTKSIRDSLSLEQEMEKTLLTHLEKYVAHAGELYDKLGKTLTVGEKDIEKYVAQYSSADKSKRYYDYLGVKEAVIKSPFPYKDAGKIVLVDTIGTGATSLGVEQDMLNTVKRDSDAVVLMKRPEPLRPRLTKDDYELLQSIRETLGADYTDKLLFWVFNRVESGKGANKEGIPALMAQVQEEKQPVAKCINVDCSNENDVRENLLVPILQQMSGHLSEIDAQLIKQVNERLKSVAKAFGNINSRMEKASVSALNVDERRFFHQPIQSTISSMTNKLRDIYIDLNSQKDRPNTELQEIASEKLKRTLLSVPSKEVIRKALNDGTVNQHNVLEYFTDVLRLDIINEFLQMDVVLTEIVRKAKIKIIETLGAEEYGRLSRLAGHDYENPALWLDRLGEKINEESYPLLHAALVTLRDFKLSVENFLIYKVRSSLETIDWTLRKNTPQLYNGMDDKDALAEEINFILHDLLESVHANINKKLKDYYTFPNEAIFAVTRDFHDRITSQSVNTNTGLSAKEEWNYFYNDFIPSLWREEYMNFGKKGASIKEWQDILDKVKACSKEDYFQIH